MRRLMIMILGVLAYRALSRPGPKDRSKGMG
jgi:hypothetical protein